MIRLRTPSVTCLLVSASALAVSTSAAAAPLRFELAPNAGFTGPSFSFALDSNPTPTFFSAFGQAQTTRIAGTNIDYELASGTTGTLTASNVGPSFFNAGPGGNQGGLSILPLSINLFGTSQFRVFGAQVYTGTASAPVFAPGTFNLGRISTGTTALPTVLDYRLTIQAVPEPASWALMIGGFALAGGALRRRAKLSFA